MHYLSIPKMGESVADAQIITWLKKEGDIILRDEAYVEISTDKVDSEIPAPFQCKVIKILAKPGSKVSVGQPIAEVEALEKVEASSQPKLEQSTAPILDKNLPKPSLKSKTSLDSTVKLSPLVRRVLIENNIPLDEIRNLEGTGADGRITKSDIQSYIQNRSHFQSHLAEVNYHSQPVSAKVEELSLEDGDEKIEFDRMRTLIARYMVESKQKSAHCTSFTEVDVTDLVVWRDKVKDEFFQKHNLKLTYTHLFMILVIDSLRSYPKLNAHSCSGGYVLKKNINLGFATALPDGNLIVPNIKKMEEMSIIDIVRSVSEIGSNAKSNQLKPDDIQNGTFTMSNTGIFGSLMGTPIINQPQVAIMSLGEILKTPAVIEQDGKDCIEVRKKMILSLSYDHRIIDGAYAASFLKNYKYQIEHFDSISF